MNKFLNLAAPQIKRLRLKKRLSHSTLASRCEQLGWKTNAQILARIEAQHRRIADYEFFCLALALRVPLIELTRNWPKIRLR